MACGVDSESFVTQAMRSDSQPLCYNPRVADHIVLLGFMGSGKTTVGALLGVRLGRQFVDLDDRIEAAAGCTIAELFTEQGEAAFRGLEAQALASLLAESREPLVIALGGGAFAQERNRQAIAGSGALTIFLDSPLDVLRERCAGLEHRPLARDPERFERLYQERQPIYRLASWTIGTGSGTPEDVVSAIAERLVSSLE
jgi:shikimate kinase